MEDRVRFTESGLRSLSLVVLSCYPVHHELNPGAMSYLREVISGKEELDPRLLLRKLPDLENSLVEYAKKGNNPEISAEAVADFFAGSFHYGKIMQELEEKKLHILPGSVYSLRIIFSHLVLPVTVVSHQEDGLIGKFLLGKFDFVIRGLVASKSDKDLIRKMLAKKAELTVLVHFATIVEVNPSRSRVARISEMLRHESFFNSACGYLQGSGGVDYNIFPRDCRRKTEKIFENISI